MIIDGLLLFSSSQAITATAASTNVIDLVNARDLGVGDDPAMKVMARVGTAFVTGDGGTLTLQLQGSTDNTTYTTYAQTGAIAASALTAGARVGGMHLPRRASGAAMPRYLRVNYLVTGTFSAGTVTASLVLDDDAADQYPAAITVAN